jgi:hypothetical protein
LVGAAVEVEKPAIPAAIRESRVTTVLPKDPNRIIDSSSIPAAHKDKYSIKIIAKLERYVRILPVLSGFTEPRRLIAIGIQPFGNDDFFAVDE